MSADNSGTDITVGVRDNVVCLYWFQGGGISLRQLTPAAARWTAARLVALADLLDREAAAKEANV